MTPQPVRPIVVGADGSDISTTAVRLAAGKVPGRDPPLKLLHAHQWVGRDPMYGIDIDGVWDQSRDILTAAAQSVPEPFDGLPLTTAVSDRRAAAPVDEPRQASMILVGSRGCGGFAGLVLGSPSLTVVVQEDCPDDPPTSEQNLRPVSDGRGGTTWIVTSGCELPD